MTTSSRAGGPLEAKMTQAEIRALEHAGRSSMAWPNEGYDEPSHANDVFRALIPAAFILAAAAALMVALF
ncbi:hypothetical protein DevBK_01655 [Devosia sp. BK]|uniref:hypothetical protein n=2 Tax=Devosia TaxID=46913 RepID=UPI00293B6D24|nr:hypothetical protein [Devosia sp. BK]MDV3250029.1 hypothetical protein [Devosia sp. BK]